MAHPSVRIYLYPCVSSYVGGDIVAGVHACRMHDSDEISLFIDIGTNGEIVVGNREWLICAACWPVRPLRAGHQVRNAARSRAIDELPTSTPKPLTR